MAFWTSQFTLKQVCSAICDLLMLHVTIENSKRFGVIRFLAFQMLRQGWIKTWWS